MGENILLSRSPPSNRFEFPADEGAGEARRERSPVCKIADSSHGLPSKPIACLPLLSGTRQTKPRLKGNQSPESWARINPICRCRTGSP